MAAFDLALSHVRSGSDDLLLPARVDQLARANNIVFRNTTLTPGATLRLFVQQIANGNIACAAVRHLAGEDFSDSAWCQARGRLPIELIERVHRTIVDEARRELDAVNNIGDEAYRWHGHRIFSIDGCSDSMPDTPELRDHYGVPSGCRTGLGFPTSHLLMMMDHRSGLLIDCVDSPLTTSDLSQTPAMHAHLQAGDTLLGDVAFCGFAHLALIIQANLHAVMPTHHRRIVDFAPDRVHAHPRKGKSTKRVGKPRARVLKTLGHNDQLVEYYKPREKSAWMSDEQWKSLPDSITVREIRRTVKRHGFRPMTVTIVTTLLDPEVYPAQELIDLRLTRWMIETNFRHLKITLGMDVLKCKTLQGVRKERLVFVLVYNLIRIAMLRAARTRGVNVNRLSFADTLAWVRYGDISACPILIVNPLRPGRLEPRVIKRQKKEFPYMTSPRADLKAQLRAKHKDTT
jgi:Transposase DDE domain